VTVFGEWGFLGVADAAANNNAGIWGFDAVEWRRYDDAADQVHRKGSISQYASETVVL